MSGHRFCPTIALFVTGEAYRKRVSLPEKVQKTHQNALTLRHYQASTLLSISDQGTSAGVVDSVKDSPRRGNSRRSQPLGRGISPYGMLHRRLISGARLRVQRVIRQSTRSTPYSGEGQPSRAAQSTRTSTFFWRTSRSSGSRSQMGGNPHPGAAHASQARVLGSWDPPFQWPSLLSSKVPDQWLLSNAGQEASTGNRSKRPCALDFCFEALICVLNTHQHMASDA